MQIDYTLDFGIIFTAIAAIVVTAIEYHQFKQKRRSILFTELNMRYLNDEKNIQPVIRFLSHLYKDATKPEGYQIELFLRFFEELDIYLKKKVIDDDTTYHLFAYYCIELLKPERSSLLKDIEFNIDEWPLLADFIDRMKKVESKG